MSPHKEIRFSPARAALVLSLVALCIVVGYSFYAALPYIEGPSMTLQETQTTEGLTAISGTTERVSFLSIDGAPVPLSEDGTFSVRRAYPRGYTALQVVARDRFGRAITKEIAFVTEQTLSTTTPYGTKKEN